MVFLDTEKLLFLFKKREKVNAEMEQERQIRRRTGNHDGETVRAAGAPTQQHTKKQSEQT